MSEVENRSKVREAPRRDPLRMSRRILRLRVLVFIAAGFIALGAVALWVVPGWLLAQWLPVKATPADYRATVLPAAQTVLFALGGLIAIVGVVLSLARHGQEIEAGQRDRNRYELDREKEDHRRDEVEKAVGADTERALRARFVSAVELLADPESAIKRTAGLYAIAALADDWSVIGRNDERQVCIDVLCGYLRSPLPDGVDATPREEVAVRQTGWALIRAHLQVDEGVGPAWEGSSFRLSQVQIDYDVDLSHSYFAAGLLDLRRARIIGAGRLNLRSAVAVDGSIVIADTLVEGIGPGPTLDLRFDHLGDVWVSIDGLRVGVESVVRFSSGSADEARISIAGTRLIESAALTVSIAAMRGGYLGLADANLTEHAQLTFAASSLTEGASVNLDRCSASGDSRIVVGSRRGGQDHRSRIEIAEGSSLSVKGFAVMNQAKLSVHGIVVEPGATFELDQPVVRDDASVDVPEHDASGGTGTP